MEDMQRDIGGQLKTLRRKAKLTQAEVAQRMGISQKHVSRMEAGQSNFSLVQLWKYARIVSGELQIQIKDQDASMTDREVDELVQLYQSAPMSTRFAIMSLLRDGQAMRRGAGNGS